MDVSAVYQCGYCGEWCDTRVDASGLARQIYVEDCSVCCRPNVLRVRLSADRGGAEVTASYEG